MPFCEGRNGSIIQGVDVRHVISVTENNPECSSLYGFDVVNLSFREQVIPKCRGHNS